MRCDGRVHWNCYCRPSVIIRLSLCVCLCGLDNCRVVRMVRRWVTCSRRSPPVEGHRTRRILRNLRRRRRLSTRCILHRLRRIRALPCRHRQDTLVTAVIPSLVSRHHSISSRSLVYRCWITIHLGWYSTVVHRTQVCNLLAACYYTRPGMSAVTV